MNVRMAGLNHNTAPVEKREKALKTFRELRGVLLATCNRVEIYHPHPLYPPLHQRWRGGNPKGGDEVYSYQDKEAVRHLFRVASGLDSQVLGEWEILGQVREAYLAAKGKDPGLDSLFEKAVEVGRKVREETTISRGNVSISSAAIAKAKERMNEMNDKKIVLVGSGKVTETVLKTLLKMPARRSSKNEGGRPNIILVANRSYNKAQVLAVKLGGRAIRFDQLKDALLDADLAISSTSAPHLVLRKEHVAARSKPLLIIDLAAPRDVDPAVAGIPKVTLLNIDDIHEEVNLNLARRKLEAVFAEKIVEEEVKKFCANYALEPAAAAWH